MINSHNSYHDNSRPVTAAAKCPNCGSNKYIETVSLESCTACGLEFSYWPRNGVSGGNAVYQQYEQQRQARQEYLEFMDMLEQEREYQNEYESRDLS
jgi:hypothetical protein